jgi:hypothetical protein
MKRSLFVVVVPVVALAALMPRAGVLAQAGQAAQAGASSLTVAFSDPARPGTIRAGLFQGSVTVRGSNRRDVLVTAPALRATTRPVPAEASGLRRLNQPPGVAIDEENNVIVISMGPVGRGDLELAVPARTNLRLSTMNGAITVEGVEGELEVTNFSGPITLSDVAGSVVAHSQNGKVTATIRQVAADKPMAFTSFNGAVDVTLPASAKANLKLRSDRGDVFTGFDVQLQAQRIQQDARQPAGGRDRVRSTRVQIDNAIYGSINGGGPEFELRTFNGPIYLRKGN